MEMSVYAFCCIKLNLSCIFLMSVKYEESWDIFGLIILIHTNTAKYVKVATESMLQFLVPTRLLWTPEILHPLSSTALLNMLCYYPIIMHNGIIHTEAHGIMDQKLTKHLSIFG